MCATVHDVQRRREKCFESPNIEKHVNSMWTEQREAWGQSSEWRKKNTNLFLSQRQSTDNTSKINRFLLFVSTCHVFIFSFWFLFLIGLFERLTRRRMTIGSSWSGYNRRFSFMHFRWRLREIQKKIPFTVRSFNVSGKSIEALKNLLLCQPSISRTEKKWLTDVKLTENPLTGTKRLRGVFFNSDQSHLFDRRPLATYTETKRASRSSIHRLIWTS